MYVCMISYNLHENKFHMRSYFHVAIDHDKFEIENSSSIWGSSIESSSEVCLFGWDVEVSNFKCFFRFNLTKYFDYITKIWWEILKNKLLSKNKLGS